MRRLGALLPFAGRRSAVVGSDARPSDAGVRSAQVGRRRLLGLIGVAPIALPAAVTAALSPEPFSSTIFFDVDESYASALARYHDELNAWADDVQVWRDGPMPARPRFDAPIGVPRSSVRPLPPVEPRAHLDDVGSGP